MFKYLLIGLFSITAIAGTVRFVDIGVGEFTQTTTPSNPASSKNRVYFKSDDKFYKLTSAGVETEIGASTASGDSLIKTITQANSFAIGDIVYFDGATWAKAKADADSTSEVIGVVSAASGSDFDVTQTGYISGLSGLTSGSTYFLSDATAGLLTDTAPTAVNSISKPVLVAISTTTAFVLQSRGALIGSGSGGGGTPDVLVSFGGASEGAECTSGTCTIYRQSGNVTSVTWTATGRYTIALSSALSAIPICTSSPYNVTSRFIGILNNTTTSNIYVATQNSAGSDDNAAANISCWIP